MAGLLVKSNEEELPTLACTQAIMIHRKLGKTVASARNRVKAFAGSTENIWTKKSWYVFVGVVMMLLIFRPFFDVVDYLLYEDTRIINQEIANITSNVLETDVRQTVEIFLRWGIYFLAAEFMFMYYLFFVNRILKTFPECFEMRYFYPIHKCTGHFFQLLTWMWVALEYGLFFIIWQFQPDNAAKHNHYLNVVICVIIMQLFYGVSARYSMRHMKYLFQDYVYDEEDWLENEFEDEETLKDEKWVMVEA